ncbi:HEPN domain-containing protein [Vibrio fluvialis]|uniref:HEPN domain-containing protein n=1 Tax=Vibrio fluvialis TaxID=676 RepID=UPI0028DFE3B6|nr:HEPN domain-containing protein [Vibrio fluvialis]MDT8866663.1 HEPN domain-containing protein [Vibrio fluvialis]MDT8874431.1 HEPN domain-containing protein [Vibrio fluvialis]
MTRKKIDIISDMMDSRTSPEIYKFADELKCLDPSFQLDFSDYTFCNYIYDFFKENEVTEDSVKECFKSLKKDNPRICHTIYKVIRGLDEFQFNTYPSLHLGDSIVIYRAKGRCTSADIVERFEHGSILIGFRVRSRCIRKSEELSEVAANKLILFFHFIKSLSINFLHVDINEHYGVDTTNHLVVTDDGVAVGGTIARIAGRIAPVSIAEEINDKTNQRIWAMIEKPSPEKNETESRLTTAIEWIGRAYLEKTLENRLVFSTISLESIFSMNKKEFITPSIVNYISESISLLITDNYDDFIKVEKSIKSIYSVRSSIVHTGDANFRLEDIELLQSYITKLIYCIFDTESLMAVKSSGDFHKEIKRIKYTKKF